MSGTRMVMREQGSGKEKELKLEHCVVSQWWGRGKSVFHFERLKVQTSIYRVSQIILSSIISNRTYSL